MPPAGEHPRRTAATRPTADPERYTRPAAPSVGGPSAFDQLNRDIRALNSSLLILGQKLQFVVSNEKILGRNVMVLNKKIKDLEEKGLGMVGGPGTGGAGPVGDDLRDLSAKVDQLKQQISALESAVENIRDTYAKDESVKELKYIIDTINPLEFVTYHDVETLVEEKLQARLGEKKAAAAEKKK